MSVDGVVSIPGSYAVQCVKKSSTKNVTIFVKNFTQHEIYCKVNLKIQKQEMRALQWPMCSILQCWSLCSYYYQSCRAMMHTGVYRRIKLQHLYESH